MCVRLYVYVCVCEREREHVCAVKTNGLASHTLTLKGVACETGSLKKWEWPGDEAIAIGGAGPRDYTL